MPKRELRLHLNLVQFKRITHLFQLLFLVTSCDIFNVIHLSVPCFVGEKTEEDVVRGRVGDIGC